MRILTVVMFFLMTTVASAATLESQDAAKKLTDQIMAKVASGDIEGGFHLMKPQTADKVLASGGDFFYTASCSKNRTATRFHWSL